MILMYMLPVTVDQIKWGSYKEWEGPYFRGVHEYKMPSNPTIKDKFLATIAATEGSNYSAVNMYDSMIASLGIVQWAECKQHSVSDMLGCVVEKLGIDYVTAQLLPALQQSNSSFKKNKNGKWRFFFNDALGEVDTVDKQRLLFLNGCGKKGTWDDKSKLYAKIWASCLANVWNNPGARKAQEEYTKERLMVFITQKAKEILFNDSDIEKTSAGWIGALRAVYFSFAANLPTIASFQLEKAIKTTDAEKWSEEWCIHIIKALTINPKIEIYPRRYEKIRPVVELLFGVSLPKTSQALTIWSPKEVVVVAPIITCESSSKELFQPEAEAAPLAVPESFFTFITKVISWLFSLFFRRSK